MYEVQVVIRGVEGATADELEALQINMESVFGAIDPAVVLYPRESELGMQFEIKEEVLGRLLQPVATRAAA